MDEPLDETKIRILEGADAADWVVWRLLTVTARLMVPLLVARSDATDSGYVQRFEPFLRWGSVRRPTPLLVASWNDDWAWQTTGEAAFGSGLGLGQESQPPIGGEWSSGLVAAGFGYGPVDDEIWYLARLTSDNLLIERRRSRGKPEFSRTGPAAGSKCWSP